MVKLLTGTEVWNLSLVKERSFKVSPMTTFQFFYSSYKYNKCDNILTHIMLFSYSIEEPCKAITI